MLQIWEKFPVKKAKIITLSTTGKWDTKIRKSPCPPKVNRG